MDLRTRYLTKSRFKLALECPTKLYYTGKPDYLDRSVEDSFLATLAEGGYQVGELARLLHPGGVEVDDIGHEAQLAKTRELLSSENVVIYEAALAFERLFVRVDVLRKTGARIELIEVKSKSYSPLEDGDFRNANGRLNSGFLPYLYDIAFQTHVARMALTQHQIHSYLMLADKTRVATVDGINQRFRLVRKDGRSHVHVVEGTTAESLGEALLTSVCVDEQVEELLARRLSVGDCVELPFADAVQQLADAYVDDRRVTPTPSATCTGCAFRAPAWPEQGQPRSGFHECWSQSFGWGEADFSNGTVLDLWNFPKKSALISAKILKLSQVSANDLNYDNAPPGVEGMSRKHRQWYQCSGDWPEGGGFYFDGVGMRHAMRAWTYPLHFIDFETSTVALPFVAGRRPYETTAFQFSHHVLHQDGRVEHRSQWLGDSPGQDPNLPFVRALKVSLDGDAGTVFRWAAHENTVLNHLRRHLLTLGTDVSDRDALVGFLDSLTTRKAVDGTPVAGGRSMVDLCKLSERHFFHPSTRGSSSLKKVLPALMRSSDLLRALYGGPSYGGPGSSLNLTTPMAWWQLREGVVMDPYELLPPVFDDVSREETKELEEGFDKNLREGGAAMAAFARLQFEDLARERRAAIRSALLRYCELDTLAMVMAVQAWMAWADEPASHVPDGQSSVVYS